MELAAGAMGTLGSKLVELLQDEFVKQRGLKRDVQSLCTELEMMYDALAELSRVPPDKISKTDKTWAHNARELSYDMEDIVDSFMVNVHRHDPGAANVFKNMVGKFKSVVKKLKYRHQIYEKIKDIKDLSKELSELHARYNNFARAAPAANTRDDIDPRLINLTKNEGRELVGIKEAREDLLWMLTHLGGHQSPLKVVSIVGSGGLGKTTLAKLVHGQITAQSFHCSAFVSVGRSPNIRNTFREMLEKLGKPFSSYMNSWNTKQFCEGLQEFLRGKRYNIVVDDVWDNKTWEEVKCALPDSNCGSKVIITTRNLEVGRQAGDVYKLKPLSPDKSKELFCKRTSSNHNGEDELVDKIIAKCDGVPLAIIAMASLLADRPLEDWQTVYDSIILGCEEDNTATILLYSYYDLPPYLKPCLLYLSMYPEDCFIEKSTLIWRWIAEGFVQLQTEGRCNSLLDVGVRYFNELLNRSMIQAADKEGRSGIIQGCRVHDIVLDLIRDLSMEENFVTILGKNQLVESSASITRRMKELGLLHGSERKVRRLSIQSCIPLSDIIGMTEVVRSLHSHTKDWFQLEAPLLYIFRACRVLSVSSNIGDLKHLGKLVHMRYLEISDGDYDELPKEIGNLKFLQTLIIINSITGDIPLAVFELRQLMCLHACIREAAANMMGNLVCLEELKLRILGEIVVDDFVVELGKLTKLRVLHIALRGVNGTCYKKLMQSLNKLQEIRDLTLQISYIKGGKPPQEMNMGLSPLLMDPSRFRRLRYLSLVVPAGAEARDILGNLALLLELHSLSLQTFKETQGFIVVAEGFRNLRSYRTNTKPKFMQGAMPRVESLHLMAHPGRDLEQINLATLVSLKKINVKVNCRGCFRGDVEEGEAVVRRIVEDHPNRPTLRIWRLYEGLMLPDDDMKPDKVVSVPVIVRDCWRDDESNEICDDVKMWHYGWLEEITCNIDCEGSRLSDVEKIEASLRYQATWHRRRPKLVINRINQDKMVGSLEDHSMQVANRDQ